MTEQSLAQEVKRLQDADLARRKREREAMRDFRTLETIRALHRAEPTGCGCGENGWWCRRCQRCAPCDTMLMLPGGVDAIRTLHHQGKYWKKIRDGWFQHHLELRRFCYADMQAWPCLTAQLVAPESAP